MYCTNCGNKLDDTAKFCPYCGQMQETRPQPQQQAQAPVAEPAQQPAAPVYTAPAEPTYTAPAAPVYETLEQPNLDTLNASREAEKSERASQILIKGILSLVFPETFILAFLGLIFAGQGKRLAARFEADYGMLTPKARVGKYLSVGGFIFSLVMTILLGMYVIAFVLGFVIGLLGL